MKKFVVPDNRGRITIHEDIRKAVGLTPESILCLTPMPDKSIVITIQKVCDNCRSNENTPLSEVVMHYPEKERDKALVVLSGDWARRNGGADNV